MQEARDELLWLLGLEVVDLVAQNQSVLRRQEDFSTSAFLLGRVVNTCESHVALGHSGATADLISPHIPLYLPLPLTPFLPI